MKKNLSLSIGIIFFIATIASCSVDWDELYELHCFATEDEIAQERKSLPYFGENHEITSAYNNDLAIKCNNGVFVGTKEDTVKTWKGIPYATQPVNELRWKAPKPAEDSDKIFEAKNFGHVALQGAYIEEISSLYTQGEDCLNLNIWANDNGNSKLRPIMVFIHGGAYISGGSADPSYDCKLLAQDNPDVIFITINYRLGVAGFANFEKVKGGKEYYGSDNLGILDQIEALKWIQKNASSFGGDSNNITIFGESAGAGSVMALVASNLSEGLFHHAIAESGNAYSFVRTKKQSQSYTKVLMKLTHAKTMDDLLSLSSQELAEADLKTYMLTVDYTYPVCDDYVLPSNILEILENGKGKDIDIMTGTTKDEMKYWPWELDDDDAFVELYSGKFNASLNKIGSKGKKWLSSAMKERDITDKCGKLMLFYDFKSFHTPARQEAKAHSKGGGNSYIYYFTEESTDPKIASFHGFELRYVFNHPDDLSYSDEKADLDLCRFIQRSWVNFAKTGNPSIPAGEIGNSEPVIWKQYTDSSKEVMILNSSGCHMESDPLQSLSEAFEEANR